MHLLELAGAQRLLTVWTSHHALRTSRRLVRRKLSRQHCRVAAVGAADATEVALLEVREPTLALATKQQLFVTASVRVRAADGQASDCIQQKRDRAQLIGRRRSLAQRAVRLGLQPLRQTPVAADVAT